MALPPALRALCARNHRLFLSGQLVSLIGTWMQMVAQSWLISMMFMGMAPLGALMAGSIAAPLGASITVAIGGAACIIGGAVFAARIPRLRGAARELIVAQMAAGGPADEATCAISVTTDGGPAAQKNPEKPVET